MDTEHVIEEPSQQAVSSTTGDEAQHQEEAAVIQELPGDDIAAQIVEVSTVSPVAQTILPPLQQTQTSTIQTVPSTSSNK